MADVLMVAERTMESLTTLVMRSRLDSRLSRVMLWGVADEFRKLERIFSIIRRELLSAELQEDRAEQVKRVLLESFGDSFFEADDILDYLAAAAWGRRLMSRNKIATKVRSFFSLTSSNPIVFGLKMRYALKKITKEFDGAFKSSLLPTPEPETRLPTVETARGMTHHFVFEDSVIGRDFEKGEIVKLVLEAADTNETDQQLRVAPIVGIKGIGKTTLAQLVFNSEVVRETFDVMAWAWTSDLADVRFTVQQLITDIRSGDVGHYLQMDQLQNKLRKAINGKRFFLVLDGVCYASREKWLSIRNLLTGGAKGSTVLVTTRDKNIAEITRTVSKPYQLGPLSHEDSWLLLKTVAFDGDHQEQQEVHELEEIGTQVVGKCRGIPLLIKTIGSFMSCFPTVHEWLSLLDEERFDEVMRFNPQFEADDGDQETKVATGKREQTHSFIPEEEVIGRNADKEAIMKLLFDGHFAVNDRVIAIVGAAGLGKTTLAQLIFNESWVQDYFDLRIWVCVTDVFDVKDMIAKVIASLTTTYLEQPSMEDLVFLLHQKIEGRRCLFVYDDVWNDDSDSWLQLRNLLVDGKIGSGLIVTTRNEGVALVSASNERTYKLKPLDDDSCWSLFVKVAFEKRQQPTNSKILKIGKEIVANCGGNPFAIRTIGGILYFKKTEKEWQSFYEKELPKILTGADMRASLKLSYDQLPYYLRPCFAYCGLFPKDYEIDVPMLINLWISQGFIRQDSHLNPEAEDVGYHYFVELLRRSFFQETMRDELGRITKCKMQNFMCDLARSIDPNGCATLGLKGGIDDTKPRHVSFDFHLDSSWHIRLLPQSKRIRSLILPRQMRQEVEGRSIESVCNDITKFEYLRTLDLHNSGIKVVSDSIGDLKLLRYLDLSQNLNIKKLPSSIGRLWNLQTLKLNHCSNLQKLPRAIKKLVSLRNLENDSCYSLTHMPRGLGQLTSLRILSEFVLSNGTGSVSNKTGKLDELEGLNKLRGKLKIKNLRCLGGDGTTRASLTEKEHLVSLILVWDIDAAIRESDCEELLEDLQPHPNLRELSLSAYGGVRFSSWLPGHKNLVKLSLSRCMNCKCLPQLYNLPLLEALLVDDMPELEFISNKTSEDESQAFFQSLKELQLTNLPKLARWWEHGAGVKGPTFPSCLSKLIIEDCPSLISMPRFPALEALLVLNNTRWEPFQETISAPQIPSATSEASSSSSSTDVALSKLKALHIINMPNGGLNTWQSFSSLRSLTFDHVLGIKTFLEGLEKVTNLHELHIWRCASLEEIGWISNIRSLRILSIKLCPNLTIPRDKISLITSLQKVKIEECSQVSHIESMLEGRFYR